MSNTKKCPFCGEEINEEAIKCRFCGEILDKLAAKDIEKKCLQESLDKPIGEQSSWRKFLMIDSRRSKQKLIGGIITILVVIGWIIISENGGIPFLNRRTVSIESLQQECLCLLNVQVHKIVCERPDCKDWLPWHTAPSEHSFIAKDNKNECPIHFTKCTLIKQSEYTYTGLATLENNLQQTEEIPINCTYSGDGNILVEMENGPSVILKITKVGLSVDFPVALQKQMHSLWCEGTQGKQASFHVNSVSHGNECIVRIKNISIEDATDKVNAAVAKVVLTTDKGHDSPIIEYLIEYNETGAMTYKVQNNDEFLAFVWYCTKKEGKKLRD